MRRTFFGRAASRPWTTPDSREMLFDLAAAYDTLAKTTETLARQPISA